MSRLSLYAHNNKYFMSRIKIYHLPAPSKLVFGAVLAVVLKFHKPEVLLAAGAPNPPSPSAGCDVAGAPKLRPETKYLINVNL